MPISQLSQTDYASKDLAAALAETFPPLARYWPRLTTVSVPQAAFFLADDREILYGGAAGGGKSDAVLAGALQYVDVPGYAALILRRTFKQLSLPGAIMARSKQWLRPHREVRWGDDDKTWTFPSGATLTFGFLEHADDIYRYQGPEFQYIGFDELTQFYEEQYVYLFSRLRRHMSVDVPVRMRAASNPGGVGHRWVRKRFKVPGGPASFPIRADRARVFIPAKIADNPGLDAVEYEESLSELAPELRAQLMRGDWGAFEGAAFDIRPEHLIADFRPGDAFERFEALDYGLNGAPWSLWQVDYDGNLIVDDMVYERNLLPSELAPIILARRAAGWGDANDAYCDPSVWHRTGTRNRWGDPAMLADEFSDNGVTVRRANNDPRAGLIRLRELLACDPEHRFPAWHPRAGEPGAPRLFIRAGLADLLEELTAAPLQPIEKRDGGEIVDPEWESRHGHSVAMCRYAVMTRPSPSREPEKTLAELLLEPVADVDLRSEMIRKRIEEANRPKRRRRAYT